MKYLYFGAPWCGPCKMMKPMLDKLAEEVVVEKYNIDDNPDLMEKYGIMKVPTIILLDKVGKELARVIGSTTQTRLKQLWNENDSTGIF